MQGPKVEAYYNMHKALRFWIDHYLGRVTPEQMQQTVRPGGNTGIWILGHLIACDDDLALYLEEGECLFADYQKQFKRGTPTDSVADFPSLEQLRADWSKVCAQTDRLYQQLSDADLDSPHHQVQGKVEDDFFKTKENVLINWVLHQQYHVGQLGLLGEM